MPNNQLSSVYLPSTPRVGYVISQPRLTPTIGSKLAKTGGSLGSKITRLQLQHELLPRIEALLCWRSTCRWPLWQCKPSLSSSSHNAQLSQHTTHLKLSSFIVRKPCLLLMASSLRLSIFSFAVSSWGSEKRRRCRRCRGGREGQCNNTVHPYFLNSSSWVWIHIHMYIGGAGLSCGCQYDDAEAFQSGLGQGITI